MEAISEKNTEENIGLSCSIELQPFVEAATELRRLSNKLIEEIQEGNSLSALSNVAAIAPLNGWLGERLKEMAFDRGLQEEIFNERGQGSADPQRRLTPGYI
tara:strand:+ start:217 stop:522 length:306 start_codon:yes stop_codon:yes gene_type:complete